MMFSLRTTVYRTSFFPQAIHLWNQLPGSVVEADTLDFNNTVFNTTTCNIADGFLDKGQYNSSSMILDFFFFFFWEMTTSVLHNDEDDDFSFPILNFHF
jgi:hypothetical protein